MPSGPISSCDLTWGVAYLGARAILGRASSWGMAPARAPVLSRRDSRNRCVPQNQHVAKAIERLFYIRWHSKLRWSVPHETPEGVEMVPEHL